MAMAGILVEEDRCTPRHGPYCCETCLFPGAGGAVPRPLPSWRSLLMRLKLHGPSRPEDRLEAWLGQRHQERVLEGSATTAGPCPDEVFLKDLAEKSKRIALGD